MKKFKLTTILSILITMLMVVCFACDKVEECTLNTDKFEAVVEYNGEVDISNITIYDPKSQCEISSDEFEIVTCDDTTTVGKKLLVIRYQNQTYSIPFVVKYKVEFVVDNEVLDTQYVIRAKEIVVPNNPVKEGYDFIDWDRELPRELKDNIRFEAIFSSTTLQVPNLNVINVDYGTTLQQIELPSNENGAWEFKEDLTKTVGNVGKNKFDVKFVPSTDELVERYDQVTINVSKKNLEFVIEQDSFVYDGQAHFPRYSLPVDVNVNLVGEGQVNASDTAYDYALIIQDSNYSGVYSGKYTISKADVTIKVDDKVVDYAQSFKMTYQVEGFDNADLLGITINTPAILNAGTYEVGATTTNTNINLKVINGTLTINKINLNPLPVNPTLSTVSRACVYGDKLSSITFDNSYSNGVWAWKEPSAIIDRIDEFKAVAVFTPKSSNYNIEERELTIDNIDKRTLNIEIKNNTFTYDGNEHTILYQIEDGSYTNLEIVGNVTQIKVGKYNTTLEIKDKFYQGVVHTSLIINKANPVTDFTTNYTITWFAGITLNSIKLNEGYTWKQSTTSLNEVGTHKFDAQFTPEDIDNYNIVEGQFEVVVNKANANINNVKDCYNFVYTGNVHNISGVIPSHYESALTYSYIYQNESVDNLINAGTYQVNIVLPESEHYNEMSVTTLARVDKASVEVMLQTLTATYEDTLAQVNLPVDDNGVWAWKDDLSTFVGNAGMQTHIAVYTPNNANYEVTEVEATIEVAKKVLTFEIVNNVYTYNAKAHSIEFIILDDNNNEYTDLVVSGNANMVNAGTYNFTLSIDSDNYEATKSTQLIINKAKLIPNIPTGLTAIYLDKVNSVELPNEDDGVWKWNINKDELVGSVGNNQFDAIFVYNEYDKCDNYEDYTIRLTIAVAPMVVDVPQLDVYSAIYTGHTIRANVPSSNLYTIGENEWINVGKYAVKLTLNDDKNYVWSNADIKDTSIDFEITPASAKIANFIMPNWTYGQTSSNPSATTNFGEVEFSYSTNPEGEYTSVKPINAGTYYVKAEVAEHANYYGDSQILEFTISKANVQVPSIASKVYTGSTLTADVAMSDFYTIENNGGILKGKYDVVLTLKDCKNYQWIGSNDDIITLQFEITSALNEWTKQPILNSWVYGENYEIPSASSIFGTVNIVYKAQNAEDNQYQTELPIDAGNYVAKFWVEGTNDYNELLTIIPFTINKAIIDIPTIKTKQYTGSTIKADVETSDKYTITNDGGIDVGEYPVIFTITNSNYKWNNDSETSVVVPFNITMAQATISEFVMNGWTYNQTPNEPSATTNFGKVKFSYSASEDGEYSTAKPSNAGTYYVKAEVDTTVNYNGVSDIIAFTIAQAQAEISDFVINDWIYGETASEPSATTNFGEVEFSYSTSQSGEYASVKPINAGTYYIKAEVDNHNNYVGAMQIKQFTIAKAIIDLPVINSQVYTGNTITTSIQSTELYSVSNNGGIDVGEYPVVFTIIDTNYKWANGSETIVSIPFNITMAQAVLSNITMSGWTYGNTPSTPSATTNFGTIEYSYSTSEAGTYILTKPTNVGTYYVKAEVNSTPNYAGAVKTKVFDIQKGQAEIADFVVNGWIYNQTPSLPNATANLGDIQYVYSNNQNGEYTQTVPTNAGTYYIKAKVNETDNYYGYETSALTFTINQDTPVITLPTYPVIYMNVDNIVTSGTPVAKNLKNEQVKGNWVYSEIDYVNGNNASTFTLIFNPADTINYISATTNVNITVKSVAHIGTKYYATIENALEEAVSGDMVFVDADITGKVKITQNCEIKSGVTLVLPYGSAESNRTTDGKATLSNKAYGTLSGLTCKNIVTLNSGVTLTNNGILEVAGEVSAGAGGYPYAGHTVRDYAKLVMNANSIINSNGTILCTGFIYEATRNNGSQININKGSIEMPFVIRDFRGGSYMYAAYKGVKSGFLGLSRTSQEVSPFNQYQVRNVSAKIIVKHAGSMVGYINLYASSQVNFSKVNFVGNSSSSTMQLTDSTYSYLQAKYNPDNDINYWDVYGGMKLNAMELSVSGTTINTSGLYFPLNWCFNLTLNQHPNQTTIATYNMQQKLKMLPGSVVTVNKGASATFDNLNIYTTFNDTSNIGDKYPTKDVAKLIVNGSVTANKLGGNIYSATNGATVTINSSVSMTTKETDGAVSGSSFTASIAFQSVTNTATFYYGSTKLVASSTGTYKFDGTKWSL